MFKNVKYSRQQNAENYKSQLDSLLTVFFFGHINTTSKGCQDILHVQFLETWLLFAETVAMETNRSLWQLKDIRSLPRLTFKCLAWTFVSDPLCW